MAITVDTTVGGASANSYITVQEFKDFLAIRSNVPATISGAADDTIAKWLLQACREIDLHAFKGAKYVTGIDADGNPEQALEFPRSYTYSTNGGYVPMSVKYAQCEQALEIARFEAAGQDREDREIVQSFSRGGVSVTFRDRSTEQKSILADKAKYYLQVHLASSAGTVKLVR